jgi:hypothetical protein
MEKFNEIVIESMKEIKIGFLECLSLRLDFILELFYTGAIYLGTNLSIHT